MERPKTLYHGSRFPGVLTELRPTGYPQEKNGVFGNFVFATHRLDQAILYAADFPAVGSFSTVLEPRTESGTLLLFANEMGQDYLARPVKGHVYELPSQGFEQVLSGQNLIASREWISGHQQFVKIPEQMPLRISHYQQVMEAGVQIFTLSPDVRGQLSSLEMKLGPDGRADQLGRVLAQPKSPLVWQNHEHKIGMDQAILRSVMNASRLLLRRKFGKFQPD